MEPKKNPAFELESRRSFYFLIGLALALLLVIVVIQIRTEKKRPLPSSPEVVDVVFVPPVPHITRPEEEKPAVAKARVEYNEKLPPEVVEDTSSLRLEDSFSSNISDDELEAIGEELELPTEELHWEFIEKVARPVECEEVYEAEEQRECLNHYMKQFVHRHTRLPRAAERSRLEGVVTVSFVVDENGEVVDVQALMGPHELLKEEAERVIKSLPRFIPASNQGRKARMRMNLRINFKR